MTENIREMCENNEKLVLQEKACLSAESRGRAVYEEPDELRTCFQRDRDRIIHAEAFRRLKHKTQVFLAPSGDHYRTRLTHTLEVAQIARTIARALRLNEDLCEAIALGHDLGHTPFGHAGERALNELCPLGFKHYEQSVRVVERLEKGGRGLNLTEEVKNGILCHTKGEEAFTLEGQVIRIADKIAYINHDIDDAEAAGIINEEDIPLDLRVKLGMRKSERINNMVLDVVKNSDDKIRMSEECYRYFNELFEFMYYAVYHNPIVSADDDKATGMIQRLYRYFTDNPNKLPEEYKKIANEDSLEIAVCDYIASMSDNYSVKIFNQLFVPKFWIE